MSSIFTKIIKGDIPSYKVGEDDDNYAFLDIGPINNGHTLVVPKVEVDYIYDLEEEQLMSLHRFSRKVALAMKKVIPCNRIGIMVMGLEVPHAHVHLIPIDRPSDMDFTRPKMQMNAEEMKALAKSIQAAL